MDRIARRLRTLRRLRAIRYPPPPPFPSLPAGDSVCSVGLAELGGADEWFRPQLGDLDMQRVRLGPMSAIEVFGLAAKTNYSLDAASRLRVGGESAFRNDGRPSWLGSVLLVEDGYTMKKMMDRFEELDVLVVLFFSAGWCHYCAAARPFLHARGDDALRRLHRGGH